MRNTILNYNVVLLVDILKKNVLSGVDCGGVRREWFNQLCSSLFDARNELFTAFSKNQQALVHPNSKRPPSFKLKHYEFAGKIVGKCLFESALGGKFR